MRAASSLEEVVVGHSEFLGDRSMNEINPFRRTHSHVTCVNKQLVIIGKVIYMFIEQKSFAVEVRVKLAAFSLPSITQ